MFRASSPSASSSAASSSSSSSSSLLAAHATSARLFVANHTSDWTLLASPVAWFRCFELLFAIRWPSRLWRWGHHTLVLVVLALIGVFCYLFYELTFNTGQYLKLLSSFAKAANNASASTVEAAYAKGQGQYSADISVTVVIVVFISVVYAIILTIQGVLAAMWRRGIYDQLFSQQFSSEEDAAAAILWHTSRSGHASCLFDAQGQPVRIIDLPSRMSTELHQFTATFSTMLFGNLFYNGLLEATIIVAMLAQYTATNSGDGSSGIGMSFAAFFFCLLLLTFVNLFYNRLNRFALYYRAELRNVVQRLLEFAESVAFYGTSSSMELPRVRALLSGLHYYLAFISAVYGCVNFPIALLGSMSTVVTYILPVVLFFYLRDSSDQTPADANAYIVIISFYSALFSQLSNFLLLSEPMMITVNMGHRVHELRAHMRTIHAAWTQISARERATQRRRYEQEQEKLCFEIAHLKVLVPTPTAADDNENNDNIDDDTNKVLGASALTRFTSLQDDLCVPKLAYGESLLLYGSSGCGKTSVFRICAGLWPVDVLLANDSFTADQRRRQSASWWPLCCPRRAAYRDGVNASYAELLETRSSSTQSSSIVMMLPHSMSYVLLPPASSILFVPQKPYNCLGTLRDQLLLLLSVEERSSVTSEQLLSLLAVADLTYLATRFGFERECEWAHVLSLGEQQQIAFLRVLAGAHLLPAGSRPPVLLMLDESTSAIDVDREQRLYQALKAHGIWYISISHRPSLKAWHQHVMTMDKQPQPQQSQQQQEQQQPQEVEGPPPQAGDNAAVAPDGADDKKAPAPRHHQHWRETWTWVVRQLYVLWAIFLFLHVPFENTRAGRWLCAKTCAAWALMLMCIVIYVYYTYELALSTFSVFSVLADYASQSITVDDAKNIIAGQVGPVIGLNLGTLAATSAGMALGQYIGSLYTLRQSQYFAGIMLAANRFYHLQQRQQQHKNVLIHGGTATSQLPSILSQDIPALNSNLFFFLAGSIYYTGALTILGQAIALGQLLSQQVGGVLMIELMILSVVVMSIAEIITLQPYIHFEGVFQKAFDTFAWRQRRVDAQAEQIALSPAAVRQSEAKQLHQSLLHSCVAQIHSALWYGLFCIASYFSHRFEKVLPNILPPTLFFVYMSGSAITTANADILVAVAVYVSLLQPVLNNIVLGIGQPWGQMCILGERIIDAEAALLKAQGPTAGAHLARKSAVEEQTPNPRHADAASIVVEHLTLRDVYPEHTAAQTTASTTLVSDLTFALRRQDNLLIRGPSGCGKSQLLRLIAGLLPMPVPEPPQSGGGGGGGGADKDHPARIVRPPFARCIFLSQRLYLIRGTLREQLNYFARARQLPDVQDSRAALELVHMGYLLQRFNLDTLVDWEAVLSCGEQQRLVLGAALACPNIDCIFLDETFAACDVDVELDIYTILQNSGKQFVSISHRPEVARFHTRILSLDPLSRSFTLDQ